MQLAVDAQQPCRMFRAIDNDSVQRSTDGGATWQTVFRDGGTHMVPAPEACTPSTPPSPSPMPVSLYPSGGLVDNRLHQMSGVCPVDQANPAFHMTSLLAPGAGRIVLGEDGNGDALVQSTDAGATWSLSNGGVGGLAGQRVEAVAAAPEDSRIMYAVTAAAGGNVATANTGLAVFHSTDSGRSWAPGGPMPLEPPGWLSSKLLLQVDPLDPSHVWLVASSFGYQGWTLYESVDSATTWTSLSSPTSANTVPNSTPSQLVATVGPTGRTRLFVNISFKSGFALGCASPGGCSSSAVFVSDDGSTWTLTNLPAASGNGGAGIAADPHHPGRMLWAGNTNGKRINVLMSDDWFGHSTRLSPLPAAVSLGTTTPFAAAIVSSDLIQVDDLGRFHVPAYDYIDNPTAAPTQRSQYWVYTPPSSLVPGAGTSVTLPAAPLPSALCTGSVPCSLQPCTSAVLCSPGSSPCTANGPCSTGGTAARASCQADVTVSPTNYQTGSPTFDDFGTLALVKNDLVFSRSDYWNIPAYHARLSHMVLNANGTCTPEPDIDVSFSPDQLHDPRIAWNPRTGDPTHPVIDELAWDTRRNVLWVVLDWAGCSSGEGNSGSPQCLASPPIPLFAVTLRPNDTADAHLERFAPNSDRCGGSRAEDAPWFTYDAADDALWVCTGELSLATGSVKATCVDTLAVTGNIGNATWTWSPPDRLWVENEDDQTMFSIDQPASGCTDGPAVVHANLGEPNAENEQFACDPVTFGAPVMWMRNMVANTFDAFPLPAGSCPAAPAQGPDETHPGTLPGVLVSPVIQPPLPPPPASQLGAGNATASQAQAQAESATVSQAQTQAQAEAQAQVQAQAQSQAQAQAESMAQVQPGLMVQPQRRTQVATQQQGIGTQAAYQASALRRSRAPVVGVVAAFLMFGAGVLARRPRWATSRLDRGRRFKAT